MKATNTVSFPSDSKLAVFGQNPSFSRSEQKDQSDFYFPPHSDLSPLESEPDVMAKGTLPSLKNRRRQEAQLADVFTRLPGRKGFQSRLLIFQAGTSRSLIPLLKVTGPERIGGPKEHGCHHLERARTKGQPRHQVKVPTEF